MFVNVMIEKMFHVIHFPLVMRFMFIFSLFLFIST